MGAALRRLRANLCYPGLPAQCRSLEVGVPICAHRPSRSRQLAVDRGDDLAAEYADTWRLTLAVITGMHWLAGRRNVTGAFNLVGEDPAAIAGISGNGRSSSWVHQCPADASQSGFG